MSTPALSPAGPRHSRTPRHRRSRPLRALDLLGRLGSLVTLGALLVVAGAVGGLVDGSPVDADATVTVTFGNR